jgi:hypothetical protein
MKQRPYLFIEETGGPWDDFSTFSLLRLLSAKQGYWKVLYQKKRLKDKWEKSDNVKVYHLTEKSRNFSEIRKTIFLTEEEFFAELL